MRIIHNYRIKHGGIVGGVEYHIKYLAEAQARQHLEPIVLSSQIGRQHSIKKRKHDGVTYIDLTIKNSFLFQLERLGNRSGRLLSLATGFLTRMLYNLHSKKIEAFIHSLHPDIIHQHAYISGICINSNLKDSYPIVFTNHSGEYLLLEKTRVTRWLQKKLIRNFDHVIAPSTELLPDRKSSTYIPNGFDSGTFYTYSDNRRKVLRETFHLNGKFVFLCARRWAPTKGVLYLAKALHLLPKEVSSKCVFLFAGNETSDYKGYSEAIKKLLETNKNCDIRLLGNLPHSDLLPYIQCTDVGIIPSLMEGMSLFSLELLGCGIPVLATRVGGLPEVIKHRKNGWLVPPKNAKALADCISELVKNGRERMITVDETYYHQHYSWNRISEKTQSIYQNII